MVIQMFLRGLEWLQLYIDPFKYLKFARHYALSPKNPSSNDIKLKMYGRFVLSFVLYESTLSRGHYGVRKSANS